MKMSAQEKIDWYRQLIRCHAYIYYTLDDNIISDFTYDIHFRKLQELEKKHPALVTEDSPTQLVGENISLMHGSGKTKENIIKMLETMDGL